jgi:hypothetical protein
VDVAAATPETNNVDASVAVTTAESKSTPTLAEETEEKEEFVSNKRIKTDST